MNRGEEGVMLLMRNEWLGVDCAHGRYSIMRIP